MSIISLMQYITEYCNILQYSTIGLSTQSKYASTILKIFSAVTHNTHVDDTKHHLTLSRPHFPTHFTIPQKNILSNHPHDIPPRNHI